MKRTNASGGRESTRADVAASGSAGAEPSKHLTRWEWILLALLLAVGGWLRLTHLDLLEFQGDEAYAANLALEFVRHGTLPSAGLMSSVGVTNPPLFIYLLVPLFAISANPVFVSCCIAVLGLLAVVACWHIGRTYYGPVAGLVAASLFAVAPWAVIYSRKIWAQDFVPVFATATMWAVHALVLGKKAKAIFWVVLLPLCVVQIHFSGLALTAVVIVIVAWLRPRIDWRFAAAGLAVAIITMLPYFKFQQAHDWADFKQAMRAVGGGQRWEQLHGVTIDPMTGYRMPSQQYISYALDIMNGGRIEDVLGISAASEVDRAQVYGHKAGGGRRHFSQTLTLGDWLLVLQRIAFVVALVWLGIVAVRSVEKWKVLKSEGRSAWLLLLWAVIPILVFWAAGLWVYLTYFMILYPLHFLACGAAVEQLGHDGAWPSKRLLVGAAVAFLLAGNMVFLLDFYRFVGQNGGAQGTFGSGIGYKQEAARFLAEKCGARLRTESELQLQLAMARTVEERNRLVQSLGQPMMLELNHQGQPELPQLEWPLLVTQARDGRSQEVGLAITTNTVVLLVDGNREALQPPQWQQLAQYPNTNFGPIRLYFVAR